MSSVSAPADLQRRTTRVPLWLEAGLAHFTFPVVMLAALAAAIHWIESGVSPLVAMVGAQVPAYLVVIVLERVVPYHRMWNRSHDGDFAVDLGHGITITIFGALLDPLFRVVAVAVAAWLAATVGFPVWPVDWPLWGQLALALVLGELGQYWVHRLQHETDLLWRIHALHHSAPRLYWLNAARFHPFDIGLNAIAANFVLILLGAGLDVLVLWLLFSAIHGIFQHANIPVRIGPLNWLFSMTELHRWHHSRLVEESNRNYGQNLIVWDVVFGTRFLPADREPPRDIGLSDLPAFPMRYLAQLASPFRWSRIVRDGAVARAGVERLARP